MHLPILPSHLKDLLRLPVLLLFSLSLPYNSSQSATNLSGPDLSNLSSDYGMIIHSIPKAVLNPESPRDISLLLKSISSSPANNTVTAAPRGAAHSTYGQAEALGGVVINMTSLPDGARVGNGTFYVDAGGGSLWVDVLRETLKHGLTPRSWTDYLYLTVGGTLSFAGISGQAFRYGPQIANVLEVDVVTGKGDLLTCSKEENPELFYGVLGGLGQFGIITRARIILKPAPKWAKRVRLLYEDFARFTGDQERLITEGKVDYVEGFIEFDDSNSTHQASAGTGHEKANVHYILELALYYDDAGAAQEVLDRILPQLRFVPSAAVNVTDVTYFDFLNRVRAEELFLRERGEWEVPHPWLNLFVPRTQIRRFRDLLLETISGNYSGGTIIIYPTLRNKWNLEMSAVIPEEDAGEDIMYIASVLRSAPPSCTSGTQCLETFLRQNKKIINIATARPDECQTFSDDPTTTPAAAENPACPKGGKGGMGAKQYLPYWKNEKEWRLHFGERWERFKQLKSKFDPLHILTPGQRIFKRKPLEG